MTAVVLGSGTSTTLTKLPGNMARVSPSIADHRRECILVVARNTAVSQNRGVKMKSLVTTS